MSVSPTAPTQRMPALFVGHGSPMNAVETNRFTEAWRSFGASIPKPRAILAVSAHWYVNVTAVTAMPRPRTIHDFYGFPQRLFEVDYPAPGDPALAEEVADIVKPVHAGLDADSWGLDHGTWSVLVHLFPNADVPVVQLSIHAQRELEYHVELGRKLAPLRDRGVLVLASGNVVHNLRAIDWSKRDEGFDWARRFDDDARAILTHEPSDVLALTRHPDFDRAVPSADHFAPLLYLAGIANTANRPLDVVISGYAFGSLSMTAYAMDAPMVVGARDSRPAAGLPNPADIEPADTNT